MIILKYEKTQNVSGLVVVGVLDVSEGVFVGFYLI